MEMIHLCVHNSKLLVPVLSQIDSIYVNHHIFRINCTSVYNYVFQVVSFLQISSHIQK